MGSAGCALASILLAVQPLRLVGQQNAMIGNLEVCDKQGLHLAAAAVAHRQAGVARQGERPKGNQAS